jgi:hypothetical protein
MADPPIDDTWPSTSFNGCKPPDHSLIPDRYQKAAHCLYRADGHDLYGWTPAIHMFRWASRITLEVTGVRVERLQDINEADARAEGAPCADTVTGREVLFPVASNAGSYRLGFHVLWDSINGADSWDANPWVWVIEFNETKDKT